MSDRLHIDNALDFTDSSASFKSIAFLRSNLILTTMNSVQQLLHLNEFNHPHHCNRL